MLVYMTYNVRRRVGPVFGVLTSVLGISHLCRRYWRWHRALFLRWIWRTRWQGLAVSLASFTFFSFRVPFLAPLYYSFSGNPPCRLQVGAYRASTSVQL